MSFQNLAVKERIRLGKKFSRELKSKLGPVLHEALIFGSTAKDKAKKDSDIDLVFVVRKPTPWQKEKWLWGRWCLKRHNCTLNFFKNSHLMFQMKHRYEYRYNIEFSCHIMWPDQFKTTKIPFAFGTEPLHDLVDGRVIDCLK